ncbi:hypothetical protein JCGZ_04716 [Jatropha curcas]|uniref:Bet v I/Major latex protein domain-containing protein n=1 Tax=Jatropha curcas TaxID=180498 RepID=A0A067KSV4_JATCU|nr:MLP-like protein 34 [Jatropha curcas]KDP38073.1 hypothetical protein JCGZ_04716 [Jatropha curcas]
MELAGNLEADVELKSSANEFFKVFTIQRYLIPIASPDKVQHIFWETAGSVKLFTWKYTIDGKQEIFKEKTEIDEPNNAVTLTGVEGDPLEQYKSYKGTFTAIPKNSGALVKINLEYEKFKPSDAPPTKYLNFLISLVKDVDAYLVKR